MSRRPPRKHPNKQVWAAPPWDAAHTDAAVARPQTPPLLEPLLQQSRLHQRQFRKALKAGQPVHPRLAYPAFKGRGDTQVANTSSGRASSRCAPCQYTVSAPQEPPSLYLASRPSRTAAMPLHSAPTRTTRCANPHSGPVHWAITASSSASSSIQGKLAGTSSRRCAR